MEVSDEVWDIVNMRNPTEGFLATADSRGRCNAACIGSLQLSDRSTMTMFIGDNRTLHNLKENPRAVFITSRGGDIETVNGCRVYLEVTGIVEEGPVIDRGRAMMAEAVDGDVARRMKAFVTFDVKEVRPLLETEP